MSWYKPWTWGDESKSATDKRDRLNEQGFGAAGYADESEGNARALGLEAAGVRQQLGQYASGQQSLSREQLRQGLQQNVSSQMSMAAGARPGNAAAAARQASMNAARAGTAMSGQAAMAGIAERQAAQKALADMIMQQRQQDQQAALGSRQNAVGAYGGVTPDGSFMDKWGNAIAGGAAMAAKMSDRRVKTDVRDGDKDASKAIEGLRAYTYKYKDEKHGKGKQLGIMAQGLEKAGLGHAVIETAEGKAVHGGALSTANTAMIAALGRRLSKIEKGKGK